MKFDLPPLSSLRAFEAAARKLSFTKASEELHLTQSAVSFQVRKLETSLGVQLFVRRHRQLSLTPEGLSFMKAVQDAFARLEAEKALIVHRNSAQQVTISASFSFSSKWLIPRLHKLEAEQADLDLRVDATDRLVDFDAEPVHLAIRYCARPPAKLRSVLLFVDQIFPVCSPRLIDAIGNFREPAEIADHTLLHDEMYDYTWRDWLESTGQDSSISVRGHHFSHSGSAIDAAIGGQGIALGRLPLVADDLASGRLVRPFAFSSPSNYAYYAIWPERSDTNPFVRTVVDWLASEARGTEQVLI